MQNMQCPAGSGCMRKARGDTCSMWHPPPPPPNQAFQKATVNREGTDESAHPKRDRKPSLKVKETHAKNSNEPLTNKHSKQTKPTNKAEPTQDQEVFCTCKQPWSDGALYLDCVGPCKGWYHLKCVGLSHLSPKELAVLTYVCSECQIIDLTEDHKRETEKRLELIQKKNLIIEGLEAEVKNEKEKTQIKTSHFEQQNGQLKEDNKKLCDEVNRLTKLADNRGSLLEKHKKEIETWKSKLEKCDAQRVANQKDLTKSKSTCQTVTTRNCRLEKDHDNLKIDHSLISKQHQTLKKTLDVKEDLILEQNRKIQELELTITAQKEANKRIIDATENGGESNVISCENPDTYIEVHDDDVFVNGSDENITGSLKDLKNKIKGKDKEIESLRNLISQLEKSVMESNNKKQEVSEINDALSAETERLKEINTLLLNQIKENNPNSLTAPTPVMEPGDGDAPQQYDTTFNSDDETASEIPIDASLEDHIEEDDDGTREQDLSITKGDENPNECNQDEICAKAWYEGPNACDGSCGLNHNIDYDKLDRGICCWEIVDTCTRKDECFFCHEIPPIARNDQRVIETVRLSKIKATKRRSSNNSSPITPPVPLMSVVTNYDQQNKGHQGFQQPPQNHSFPNTPETSQNTDIAAPF